MSTSSMDLSGRFSNLPEPLSELLHDQQQLSGHAKNHSQRTILLRDISSPTPPADRWPRSNPRSRWSVSTWN